MKNIVILPHQSRYMQMPFKFPHIRWFFLLSGYGAGKTRAEVIAVLNDIKRLQGKKDRAGDYARLMICGYTLNHLEKTLLIYFRQLLDGSKSVYTENKKYNVFRIGTVTVILQPLENPGDIFGLDAHKIYVEEADELTTDKLLEAAKALNERCRQVIPGERSPCICFASTAQGQKGLYALYNHFKKNGVAFALLRARTQDNPFLPPEQIRDMIKTYTKEEQRVFMGGEFLSIAKGRVIPGFGWSNNYVEYDLDTDVKPNERVYIGMDINCIAEGELVYTLRGEVPIEKITKDDKVLTRQGYKKVINIFNNGKNKVSRCTTFYSTEGHIIRTPEGDLSQWKVKKGGNVYYLPKHKFLIQRIEGVAEEVILKVKELNLMGVSIIDYQETLDHLESILLILKSVNYSIGLFGNIITGLLFQKGLKYTISTVRMIIDLNHLYVCLKRYTQHFICGIGMKGTLSGQRGRQKKLIKRFENGIKAKKVFSTTAPQREKTGKTGLIAVFALVLSAVRSLLQRFQQPSSVRMSVDSKTERAAGVRLVCQTEKMELKRCGSIVDQQVVISINTSVMNVERSFGELKKRGGVPILADCEIGGVEIRKADGSDEEFISNVYDLEVEDAHEYFVNGVLVHNTGYSRASAYIVRDEGVIYCIKYYDFADVMDAPSVFRHDFPEQQILWIPDVTIKDSFPAYARELRKYNIKIIYRKKSPLVEDSCFLVSKLYYLQRLMVCKIAKDVAEAAALAMRDKDNKIPKGIGPSSPIHALDGTRYACTFIVAVHPDLQDIRRLIAEKRASLRNEADKEEVVKQLASGYSEINPNLFIK